MEGLGHSIQANRDNGMWKSIRLSRFGPKISHLFFADDLVILCEVQMEQARLLDSILKQFCASSGHRISGRKSNIYFSKSTEGSVRNQIPQMFGFQEVLNLSTYLRVPLLHERITSSTLSFIVEKVKRKLQNWDARNLSIARRITLALLGLALFLKAIRSGCMSFGLSMDGKIIFQILLAETNAHTNEDPFSKIWPTLRENLIWSIGDSAAARCWKDPWIPGIGSLISKIPSFANLNLDCCVKEFVNPNGSWNLDLFRVWLSEDIICRITSIPPPYPDSGLDRVIWAGSSSGHFSVRNAYWTLKEDTWNSKEEYWKLIWKHSGPQRVRVFLWLAFKNRLLTNAERVRREMGHNSSCSLCGYEFEDLAHALRDCPAAKDVWLLVLPQHLKQRFFSISLSDWLVLNLCCHEKMQDSGLIWSSLFGLITWHIWKNRNLLCFRISPGQLLK
ncbi:hypothetical protein J1N35_044627 [Gossypium stocksii]|uniref:Reverse transcriptase zinc-binding domain-containing protein n=1 Tax=Gossypium stocksii TaxID=47602 RepID=A0A9D3ZGK3_9ROSI|nr:hypothetical protein J1N35_044627 [Gossypium stocksii]